MFAPISFAPDSSDNPNRHLGILAGCDYDQLFVRGSWGAEINPKMQEAGKDAVMIKGKHALSAFVGTDLEEQLKARGIETIALGGFMANCCVESTMRDAYDRGYNVITLTDCVATTTARGYSSCVEITYPFFSTPMTCESFLSSLHTATVLPESFKLETLREQPLELQRPTWACRQFIHSAESGNAEMAAIESSDASGDVLQVGPWAVDVRQSAIGEQIVLRSGEQELKRYLAMGEATGAFGGSSYWESGCDCIYHDQIGELPSGGEVEPFGWFCHMVVLRLPDGGCLVYSPVLGPDSTIESVQTHFEQHDLLPVRLVIAPSPQHHLAVSEYQRVFPEAFYICGQASGQMLPLTKKRRDIRFDGKLRPAGHVCDGVVKPCASDQDLEPILEPSDVPVAPQHPEGGGFAELVPIWTMLAGPTSILDVCILDDNRTGEIVILHKPSKTLIVSDLLYKSCREIVGPGGTEHNYSWPEWFAQGQEELFYDARSNVETVQDGETAGSVKPLLPSYRTNPKARTIDVGAMRRSLERILAWDFNRCVACHTDPIDGEEARTLIRQAWSWVWEC